ncbi:MAG: CsgE family curli-type amyloid fiber assembly protein [Saprospiraceae bacterium]
MKHFTVSTIIFLFCCFSFLLNAQTDIPTNEEIKLFIDPQPTNNQLIVTGKIENLSSKTFHLNYVLSISQRNKKSFRSRQKNKFQLDSLTQMEAGKVMVPFHPEAIYDISLEIFHDTVLISYLNVNNEKQKPIVGTGLIIDATRTKNGRDFYNLFNKYWLASEEETNAMIKIEEKPGRSRSSQILVFINNNLIMRQMLRTRYNEIKDQAKYGIDLTINILENNPSLNNTTNDGDLMGNGLN